MKKIVISKLPAQRFQVVLDGQYCVFTLRQKGKRIYLDLAVGETRVCSGGVCVPGADVIQSPSPHFSGSLHFLDLTGQAPPQWADLGGRFVLLYLSEGETRPEVLRF